MGGCAYTNRKRGGGKGKKAKKSKRGPGGVKKTIKKLSIYDRWMTDNVGIPMGEQSQTEQSPINKRWMKDNVGASKRTKKAKKSKGKKSKGKKRPPSPWQIHLMKIFREMKIKDKNTKLGDAMREAKKSYK